MKNSVAIVLGTRPEAIKLIPIYLELKASRYFKPVLVSTGQHTTMLKQIFDFFEIQPDIELNVMSLNQTLSSLTAVLFEKIGVVFKDNTYDFVMVQGDTTTAFVTAVSSHYYKYRLIHIEAGLRTQDKWAPFPEEANRRMIGSITDLHFAATQMAVDNLAKENIRDNVFLVGNSVIDSLLLTKKKIELNEDRYKKKFLGIIDSTKKNILVTGHRRESFGHGFEQICLALAEIAEENENCQIIYPVHLNPNIQEVIYSSLKKYNNITLLDPLPYDELIYVMSNCWLIMTDSGGIQEEAPSLNIPLIVMRDKTEREEGIHIGCSVLGGTEAKSIIKQFNKILYSEDLYRKMQVAKNPYGDGATANKIVNLLKKYFEICCCE